MRISALLCRFIFRKWYNLLFVCLGNICRSPALKGVMEHLFEEKEIQGYVESYGIHANFLGKAPDRRMQEVAQKHGMTLENRAKIFEASFFDQFDAIFCVTNDVLKAVQAMAHTR